MSDIVQVKRLARPDDLRDRFAVLGSEVPVDAEVEPGGPMAEPLVVRDGSAGERTIGNRLAVLPMEGWDGTADGRPTDLVRRRWRRFGSSGAKLVWGGEAVAVEPAGRANPRQLVIHCQLISLRHGGVLAGTQTLSTLPDGKPVPGNSTAECQVHPSGKFVYVSNRGHNSLAIYTVNPTTGQLKHVGNQSTEGGVPRNFCIDPSGRFILAANQETDTVVVLKVDLETGLLTPTGSQSQVSMPVCVKFWEPL